MSIHCPKCGFYQPEDQYCAQCGVDMQSYKPSPVPLWKRLINNWIFQLGALALVMIIFTAWDSFFPQQRRDKLPPLGQTATVSAEIPAQKTVKPPPPIPNAKPVQPPAPRTQTDTQKVSDQPVAATMANSEKPKATSKPLKKRISAFFYGVPLEQVEELISQGEAIAGGVYKVPTRAMGQAIQRYRTAWKKLSSQGHSFDFNQAKLISASDAPGDGKKNIGLFFRTTVFDASEDRELSIGLRHWTDLKTSGETLEGASLETTLNRRELLVFTEIVPKDLALTEEERTFLESHPVLRHLNTPGFADGGEDLVLVLQFK